eukprot:6211995-Pleurochrysis_carterae.AAC.2
MECMQNTELDTIAVLDMTLLALRSACHLSKYVERNRAAFVRDSTNRAMCETAECHICRQHRTISERKAQAARVELRQPIRRSLHTDRRIFRFTPSAKALCAYCLFFPHLPSPPHSPSLTFAYPFSQPSHTPSLNLRAPLLSKTPAMDAEPKRVITCLAPTLYPHDS